jgi:hypothetical protein
MKAALVSATSLAALLAFEVGLDVAIDARPAKAQAFTASPSSLFGYVLLNTSAQATTATAVETVTNGVIGSNTITLPAVGAPFSGGGTSIALTGSGTTGTNTYTVSFAAGTNIGQASSSLTTLTNAGHNSAIVTLSAQAVAPEESTSGAAGLNFGTIRIGTTIAAITVSNIGNGDLNSSSNPAAQLQVSLGASNSVFTPAVNTFSLNDTNYTPTHGGVSVATANYVFSPSAHSVGQSSTATIGFLNGGGTTNNTASATVSLTATGVGPVFKGVYNGTSYTNATAVGTSVNNAGNIALGTQPHGVNKTFTLAVSNATTDTASPTVTGLNLESFQLGGCAVSTVVNGCTADGFTVLSFSAGNIAKNGTVDITLDFSGGLATYYDADLSFNTDQGAATGPGGAGAVFTYLLTANIPEPATIVTFGMGLAGLGWVRRRRNARRSAIAMDASPA